MTASKHAVAMPFLNYYRKHTHSGWHRGRAKTAAVSRAADCFKPVVSSASPNTCMPSLLGHLLSCKCLVWECPCPYMLHSQLHVGVERIFLDKCSDNELLSFQQTTNPVYGALAILHEVVLRYSSSTDSDLELIKSMPQAYDAKSHVLLFI